MLGKFVWEVKELPYDELLGWYDFLARRPYGWRDDDRAAKLIQAQGVKEKPWKLFPGLEAIYMPRGEPTGAAATLKGSAFHQLLIMKAVGGDTIDL